MVPSHQYVKRDRAQVARVDLEVHHHPGQLLVILFPLPVCVVGRSAKRQSHLATLECTGALDVQSQASSRDHSKRVITVCECTCGLCVCVRVCDDSTPAPSVMYVKSRVSRNMCKPREGFTVGGGTLM